MSTAALLALPSAEGGVHELPFPPVVFGIIAMGAFLLLLLVTWSFRGTHHKQGRDGHDTHPGTSLGGEPESNVVHHGHH